LAHVRAAGLVWAGVCVPARDGVCVVLGGVRCEVEDWYVLAPQLEHEIGRASGRERV
jgi:hypothetical protein